MSHALQVKSMRVVVFLIVAVCAVAVRAQDSPYRVAEGWPQLPAGIKWAGVISVDADARGNIWVFHRSDPTILEFDPSGKLLKRLLLGRPL